MKVWRNHRTLFLCGLVATAAGAIWIHIHNRQSEWPGEQSRRCMSLSRMLIPYHEKHGIYPASLRDLIRDGQMTEQEYLGLRFQESPWAEPVEWIYMQPEKTDDTALFSGTPVIPWRGSSGIFFFGRADGGVDGITGDKMSYWMTKPEIMKFANDPRWKFR